MIKISDIIWEKVKTIHADGSDGGYCVIGKLNDIEIGHYLRAHEDNEISCIFKIEEADGSSIFINRTFILNDKNNSDDFFRQRIVDAYNNFHTIKNIFD